MAGPIPVPKVVKESLLKDGIPKKVIRASFKKPFDHVAMDIVLKNVTHKEVIADYRRFLQKKTIAETKRYLLKYQDVLKKVEKTYHVPKELIASILMVESNFGKNDGKYLVFSVYTSLASLMDQGVRRQVTRQAKKRGEDVKAGRFKKRLSRKSKWGLKELKVLVRLGQQGKVDFLHLKGSWAGAFGMPQFIPSSFDAYGVDWNKDGKINLDDLPDAAASVANYLRKNGWKGSMTEKKAIRVIKFYNMSHPYATTILNLSKKLKK